MEDVPLQESPRNAKIDAGGTKDNLRTKSAVDGKSIISKGIFVYVYPVFRALWSKGVKIGLDDIPLCPAADNPQKQAEKMRAYLRKDNGEKRSTFMAYCLFIFPLFRIAIFFSVASILLAFVQPYANMKIVEELAKEDPEYDSRVAYGWAIGTGLLMMFSTLLGQHSSMWGKFAARRAYAALALLTFIKPSVVTKDSITKVEEGEILNMMSSDCTSVASITVFLVFAFMSFIMIIIAAIQILLEIGVISLPAIFILIVASYVNKRVGDKAKTLTIEKSKVSDRRNIKLNETLQGMRTVKLYAWEDVVEREVSKIRNEEVKHLKELAWWKAFLSFLMNAVPNLSVCGTLLIYVQVEGDLTPARAFYVANLFTFLNFGVIILPMITVMWGTMRTNMERLDKLLQMEEDFVKPVSVGDPGEVEIKDAEFAWGKSEEPTLQNINMSIKPGSMVAIVGKVASGKSTLANGILSLLPCKKGSVQVGGSTALVSQKAFITNDSVRNNILFHDAYDEGRYLEAIHSCCLKPDMSVFVNGDMTEVGEKGVTISGGQKQRIALARAAYSKADVIVFDDPLSAMDAHVGAVVFQRCFLEMLRGKTRVFFTNQLQYCERCDYIYVLDNRSICEQGTYRELVSQKQTFYNIMTHQIGSQEDETKIENDVPAVSVSPRGEEEADIDDLVMTEMKRTVTSGSHVGVDDLQNKKSEVQSAMRAEQKTAKRPSPFFLVTMARRVNAYWMMAVALFCFFGVPVLEWLQSYFLAIWIAVPNQSGLPADALSYLVTGIVFAILSSASTPLYQYFFLRCSTLLHQTMLRSVMSMAMDWFDSTPTGRILNVFAGDVMELDLTLPGIFGWWSTMIPLILTALVPAIYILPWTTPLIFVLLAGSVLAYRAYGDVNIEVSRLYMMSIGPILSSFSCYLQGLDTIRSFSRVHAFQEKFDLCIDGFMNVSYWQTAIEAMVQVIVGGPMVAFLFMLPLSCLLVYYRVRPEITALLLLYAQYFSFRLPRALFMTVLVEKSMVSAQRMIEYIDMKPEPALRDRKVDHISDKSWSPTKGVVEFHNVQMRYKPETPLVLKNVSIKLESGLKIGVVGRTGAGKSSLFLAAFRMVELESGRVTIDGRDITSLDVRNLRGALGMIPQDTFVFSGTIRSNLNMTQIYSDEELWDVLEKVNLKEAFEEFEDGLDHEIVEKGSNLSVGTVQLMCMARVLLKKPKVIFMDEATASVDLATDTLVQKTIREGFPNSTIITIAHRINTVIDFDKILVMDQGKIVEYDTPANLLADKNSMFSDLVDSTGEKSSAELRNRAIAAQNMTIL